MKYDVIIIGGGVSGLSCAITLGSGVEHDLEFFKDKHILVIDDGNSDLRKAKLNNAPGIKRNTLGEELLQNIKSQVLEYSCVKVIEDTVISLEKVDNVFKVNTKHNGNFESDVVVLATGFKAFDINGIELDVVENPLSPKPGRIMIKTNNSYCALDKNGNVVDNLYVAGVLAGFSSMYAAASGSGVQVGINILNKYADKPIVIHDVPDKA